MAWPTLSRAILAGLFWAPTVALLACGGPGAKKGQPTHRVAQWTLEADDDTGGVGGAADGMEVEGLRGHLARGDAEAAIRPHQAALSDCYQNGGKRQRFVGGRLEMHFRVSTTGVVKQVDLLSGDLGAWKVEKCLLDVAREVEFSRPEGGEAEFALPLDFSSGRSAVQSWEAGRIRDTLLSYARELVPCGLPSEAAQVTVYVGRRGAVRSVGFAGKDVPDTWKDCAAGVISEWAFEDPLGRIAKVSFAVPIR